MKKSNNKRRIAIFTGNRSEYGLQYPIIRAVDNHPSLEYMLLVSGAHLDENFGNTLEEVENEGFTINAEIKIEMDADNLLSTAQAIGSGILDLSRVLENLQPDMMVVYGDRFEGLAAVIASSQMNIPTAHIEGGDLTEGGALDDSVRHAMTKLSHLHFTTNQQATNRVLAMGEESWRVHTVGFPAIDLISEGRYASKDEIISELHIDIDRPIVLFTQHSVTTAFDRSRDQIIPSLDAIERLASEGVQLILTYPNNDAGGKNIIDELKKFSQKNLKNTYVKTSLGRYLYHGILALSLDMTRDIACVGNSSSGIKETPAFKCPTVNIGSRQDGRLRGDNVIDAKYEQEDIYSKVKYALFDKKFRSTCSKADNPYWISDAGIKIAEILSTTKIDANLLRKKMMLSGIEKDGWFK
tara:strand:- start:980 stop:2212 length:1233 start_codon:yes stop_codon:yes gene_type:complete